MCNKKGEGERCLFHHTMSKFSSKEAEVETKADPKLISETLTELGKEGRNHEAPTQEEVKSLLDKKRFSAEFSPKYNDHDRKIQLNRLQKMRMENVTGSKFHAWSNLTEAVRSKMAKKIAAAGIIGVLAFGASGCGSVKDNAPTTPTPTSTSSAGPTAAPTPEGDLGEVIGMTKDGQAVVITDQYGSYQPVQLDPNDPLNKQVDPAIVDGSVQAEGWSEADVLGAQQYVANFVGSEGIDSKALDTGAAGYSQWLNENASKYMVPMYRDSLVQDATPVFINNNAKSEINVPFIRNGGPRVSSSDINFTSISAQQFDSGKVIVVEGNYTTNYTAKNSDVLKAYVDSGRTKEDVLATLPKLSDANGTTTIKGTMTFMYGVQKEGSSWIFSGYQNSFDNQVQK